MHYKTLKTAQGKIAFIDTGGNHFPIVFVHGNSCSSAVFKKQFSALSHHYRIVALDLPGHGRSSPPDNPDKVYNIPGYAAALHEVISYLNLRSFVIIGFSLGGNIALQYSQIPKNSLGGIMMVSSAPMKYSLEAILAYPPYEGNFTAYPEQLSELQAKQYMASGGFDVEDPSVYFMVQDAMKTDGNARAKMVASVLAGNGADETEIIRKLPKPLAMVAGTEDSAIGREYIAHLNYRNLWQQEVKWIERAQHAIPIHQANELNVLIESFVSEFEKKILIND